MEQNPSTIVANGRDGRGKFAIGNPGGPGNPHVRKVAKLRRAMFRAVTPDDIAKAIAKLVEMALEGDVPAIRELLDRTIGRPATPVTGSDGGPLRVEAIRDARPVFDIQGFAALMQQAASAEKSNEAGKSDT